MVPVYPPTRFGYVGEGAEGPPHAAQSKASAHSKRLIMTVLLASSGRSGKRLPARRIHASVQRFVKGNAASFRRPATFCNALIASAPPFPTYSRLTPEGLPNCDRSLLRDQAGVIIDVCHGSYITRAESLQSGRRPLS